MIAESLFADDYTLAIERLHAATAIYTATPVVDGLLDRVNWPQRGRFIDPSCGDGAFLVMALRRLMRFRSDRTAVADIEGWEVHPGAAAQARDNVATVLREHGWTEEEARAAAGRIIRHRDFLCDGPSPDDRYDVVAGNPPYLRYANVPPILRDQYAGVVAAYARADLLHAFLDRCADLVKPGGAVCLVTADRWLFNSGAAQLRSAIGSRLTLSYLARLDASTAFYRPKQRRAGTPPRIHPVELVLRRDDSGAPLSAQPIYPGTEAQPAVVEPTLGERARIRLGPWLGASGIFVVDSATAERLGVDICVPAVDTDDIGKDDTLRAPRRFALRTSADVEPSAPVREHLLAALTRMAPRGRRTPFWLPPESWGDLPLPHESLVIPRIAKRLRPVLLPAGVLPINHNLSLISANIPAAVLARALAAESVQEWIHLRAARLENGYLSITPSLLRSLPLSLLHI